MRFKARHPAFVSKPYLFDVLEAATTSASIAGIITMEVTRCSLIASNTATAWNLGKMTCEAPTIMLAKADDKEPIWQSGNMCK